MIEQDLMKDLLSTLDFVALDIETTGLVAERDEIIEIAAVRFVKGEVAERFQSFVKPKRGVPKFIQYLTHISPEELKNAPSVDDVLRQLQVFVADSILVGQNISFDLGFINHFQIKAKRFPLPNKYWDTAEIARIYFPFVNDHKLGTMVEHLGIELNNAHRADADAEATGLLLVKMVAYIAEHFPLPLNAKIFDLCNQAQYDSSLAELLYKLVEFQRRTSLIGHKPVPPVNPMHNVIEHNTADKNMSLEDVFGAQGLFSQKFRNYEFRSGQLDMAERVEKAMQNLEHLVVEAGTGVGKSFAYLIPSLRHALIEKNKIVVSTNTKNLQEQLFFKDLPLLKDIVPISFKAVLVKGRENYICQRRWRDLLHEQTKGLTTYDAKALLHLLIWKELSHTGDVSENSSFDKSRNSISWRKICSDRYLCHNRKCPHFNECHVMSLRKHIENASIVVVNHSLLLADLKSEHSTLGEYSYLVVDEAHNLMASASKHLGFDLSYADIITLINQLVTTHKRKKTGFLHQLETNISKSIITDGAKDQISNLSLNITKLAEEIRNPITELFNLGTKYVSAADSFGKLRIKTLEPYKQMTDQLDIIIHEWKNLQKDLRALSNVLTTLKSKQVLGYDVLTETLSGFEMRTMEIEGLLLTLQNPDLDEYALWIETNQNPDRNFPSAIYCYAPIEVNKHLNSMMYKHIPSIIFTSATLALRGSFKFFMGQSGLNLVDAEKINQAIVESPFDYEKQSRLMIASFLPEHKDRFFLNQALGCLDQVVSSTDVGTMLLFTSYKDLNSVYDHLGDTLYHKNRPFFAQGKGGSRSAMLNEFRKHDNAVLLGTSSFWEGVDIQGESLSLLILFKLPFLVPSEPIVEAYIDKLERENHDSFMHYMLPNALLRLRQGFGRLIRSKSDSGVVLIMDSRVTHKYYGQYFKQVLPTKCLDLKNELALVSEISSFFNRR